MIVANNQQSLMVACPAYGTPQPYPSQADQWREYHGALAWLFNPWTGEHRNPGDIGTDPFGLLIKPPGEALAAVSRKR